MFSAILFDLDGTLVNTNDLIIDSFRYTFEVLRKPVPTKNEIINCFGEPLHETMKKFFDDVDEAVKIYREFNLKYHDEKISPYENVEKVLKTLKNEGYKLAVVTSKNRSTSIRGLKFFNLLNYFDVLITSDEVENHKPHSEPVLKACGILNVDPSNAIMVGDSIYDIISGRNAGSKTCGVNYSFMREKLLEMKADYYIDNLIEILDIVK